MSSDFILGVLASILIGGFFYLLQSRKKKVIRQQLKDLDQHLEYVGRLRESEEYRLGMAFFFLFVVLFCISVGLLIPAIAKLFSSPWVGTVSTFISFMLFLFAAIAALTEARSFRDLSNMERTTGRIERQRQKLQQKLEDA